MSETQEFECWSCGSKTGQMQTIGVRHPMQGEILEKICKNCWEQWKEQQTKIINEFRFRLYDPEDRGKLDEMMRDFLNLDGKRDANQSEMEDRRLPGEIQGGGV